MSIQSNIRQLPTDGFVGDFALSGPIRSRSVVLKTTDPTQNIIGRAVTLVSGQDHNAVVGGTGSFVGILSNSKQYALLGGVSPLSPSMVLPNEMPAQVTNMASGIYVILSTTANIGDGVAFNNTTGALAAAPGGTAPGGHTTIQGASVIRRNITTAGTMAIIQLLNGSISGSTTSLVYARSKAAVASVSAGTGYARIGLLGDSTVAGARALGPAANAVRTECPVVYLKTRLNVVQSLPAIATSWIGDQSFGQTNTLTNYAYDARLSQPDGAGFAHSGLTRTVAGSMMQNNANTFRMGFLAEDAVDTFDVYYAVNTTLGSFNITRTGSTLVPVSQAGASGTGKTTLVGTLSSSNPLYVARNAGGAYIIGTDAYNSAIKSIRLFGLGWSGGKVADWIVSTQGFDPLPALVALNLDLVLIRPGINDAVSGTVPATFKTQLATLVDTLIAAGTNVALATHYPSNIASAAQAVQDVIAQQVRDVATERGLALRDTYADWGTWVAANALGYMSDNLHPNKAGYEAEAVSSTTFLLGVVS